MKTIPKVGDRVYWYATNGERYECTVESISGKIITFDKTSRIHYRAIQGRLVKKKKRPQIKREEMKKAWDNTFEDAGLMDCHFNHFCEEFGIE